MATGKSKTIHEIDDIAEMFQAMMALDISCKGLKTLDQMKAKVKEDLHQSEREASWTAGQAFSILSEAKDEDSRKRHILTDLYNDTETCLEKMDEKILKLLQQKESNVEEKMKNHKLQLARKEYFLLVAGETSSGKSSLINLILGDELLPHSVLSTTSTICELKFGNERKIVAHFKDKDPETGLATKVIRLHKTDPGEASDEQSYLQQISPFVHVKNDREKGSIYKKIELFWPHSLLQRGIVIIDSPGVGESDLMDEIVTQYLPQAFAFIYTINSANAGGVQKDRLEKLLENVQNLFREGTDQFPSKCALFVCNKWDQVPEKEAKEVKNHVVRNLKRCWPGLDPEKQVIYISTMNATKGQNLGIITEEFSYMMEGIKSMVLKSIECRLEIHWRWLENLLSRIIFQAKAYVSNTFKDRRKVLLKITKILQRLVVIESQQNEVIADLKEYLNERVNIAVKQLSEHLSTEEVRKRFTSWTLDDVPKAKDSWESTENQIERVLSGRLREFIEQWEEDKGVFSNARESLLKHFQRRYDFVEEQLRNLQSEVIADNTGDPQTCSSDLSFTATEKVAIGVLSPIWVPLGLVALLIGAPIVGIAVIREKIVDKRKLKKYEADKCAFMTKLSEEYLSLANTWIALQRFVKEQLEDAYLCLKQIKARIPELIRADKMLCEELSEETRGKREILDLYQPILFKATEIRGNLDLFGFEEVFGYDISSKELDWKEDESHRLGRGAFGVVYKGIMTKYGSARPVALKVCIEALSAINASDILTEVENLRKLDHPFIVKFYGTSLLNNNGTKTVVLVMEKCKDNLRERIFGNPERCPGKARNPAVVGEVCRWAKQITHAVDYIHKKGIVHRDLKLENVLLSDDNEVRITDVGVSKLATDITGTLAGTPVYMAPEVFGSEMYEFGADIYSLGIMLWEMWYGQQAFEGIAVKRMEDFFDVVNDGFRPDHVKNCKRPPARWEMLMKQCWSANPDERPTAEKCKMDLIELSKAVIRPLY